MSATANRAVGFPSGIAFHRHAGPVDFGAPVADDGLTEESVVRRAMERDERIQVALAKVRVAEAEANQARLLPNPILGIDVRYPRGSGSNTVFEATISQDLLGIIQKPAQISAADDRLRMAAADALATVLDVLTEARSTYAAACEIELEVASARERQGALRKVKGISELRLREGDISKLDVTTLDAQLEQGELDLADLDLKRSDLRLQLARLIGQPSGETEWRLAEPERGAAPHVGEADLVAAGLAHRPEIQSKVWELRALGEEVTLAGLAPLQGLDAGAHVERDPQWRVGPTVTVPLTIFDWGQASRAKAEALRSQARHELVDQQRQAIREIRLAFQTFEEAAQSWSAARGRLVPAQDAQVRLAREAYKLGEADLTTTLLAENEYRLAQVRLAQLGDRAVQARLKLERAVGGPAYVAAPSTRPSGGGT